jgi:hypothetical protein
VACKRRGAGTLVGVLSTLMILAMPAVAARNQLSNATVSPHSGTISTTFSFAVSYVGSAATSVWADLGAGGTVALKLVTGMPLDGRWAASRTLPRGTWAVTFRATAKKGQVQPLSGGIVTVTGLPTPSPRPSPTASPTPPQTPMPTPIAPTPTVDASATTIAIPLPSISAPPHTPIAIGGAVSEEPTASGAPAGTASSSVGGGGPLALYLLAGVLAVGLLAGIAGLAAGGSASSPGRRTAPAAPIGAAHVGQPAEVWNDRATATEVAATDATDGATDAATDEATDEARGSALDAPARDDATQVGDAPWSLDPDDPRGE